MNGRTDGWSGTSVPAWDKRLSAMSHNVPRTKRDKRPHMGQTRRAGFRPMCAGFRPPPVQPLPVRPAIAATVRPSPATFSRIRRQPIENGLASRPPFRSCPRPSETRRAFCKPPAPRLQRNQRKPSGNPATVRPWQTSNAANVPPDSSPVYPATVRPWRNLSGDRVPVATIERRNLSGNIERGDRAQPFAPDSGQCQPRPCAACQSFRRRPLTLIPYTPPNGEM